jgi:hypothetical protein
MTETNSPEGRTVQGLVLSDSDKQAVNDILRRSLGLAGLTGDDQATGDDSGTAALMISGVIYVDPPGVCIPIGA